MKSDDSQGSKTAGTRSRTSFGGRRKFMKLTSVGLGTLLAGCGGDGDGDGDGDGGDGDGDGDGGGDGGTTTGDQDMSMSGVSIDYWDVQNVQSQTASENVTEWIQGFQDETGARVQVNKSGYSQMSGQKWVQAWQNENYPVAFNNEDFYFGRIIKTGHILPFDDYKDNINDAAIDGMDWAMDLKQNAYRFWDIPGETGVINIPFGSGIRNNLTLRTDLMDQAGYGTDDIPDTGDAVEDWNQLMEIAKDVQANSDAEWGMHGHGTWPDYNDTMCPPMAAHDPEASRFISQDGTEAYPGDIWTEWTQRFQDMVHKHEISGPQTASISDEEVANMQYAGDVAMSTVEPLNYPTFIRRAPDLMENGDLQLVPYPGGNSGAPGHVGFHDTGLNKKPSNADRQRWDRKLKVGQALMNSLLSDDFQLGYPNSVGWVGIREDLWEDANAKYNESTGYKNAVTSMLLDAEVTWPYHRFSNAIIFRTIAPYIQQAVNQEITPEEAMSNARSESNEDIQAAIDELGEVGNWPIS
jgi:ABC-type glycerol-3-phosphate transport system substrate-binding protein